MPPANKPPSPKRQAPLGSLPHPKKPRQRKSPPLSVYLDPHEADVIRREAADRGLDVSAFVRDRMMHDIWYKTGDLVDQVHLLARDSSDHAALECYFRGWVERYTGFAMSPPSGAPDPAPVAAMAVPASPALPDPAQAEAPVQFTKKVVEPEAAFEPAQWKPNAGAIALTILSDFLDLMIDLVAGIWRRLNRAKWRNDDRSVYDRLIGRTPLQFLVAAVMLAVMPLAAFGPTEVGFYLLGTDNAATAATVLERLPDDMRRRHVIGYLVEERPDNVARISACLEKQRTSRHDFWCKFRMKAGV